MSSAVTVAVIGGSGFYELPDLNDLKVTPVQTPFGEVTLQVGAVGQKRVAFIARHGEDHKVPPHKINYRANLWALNSLGVKEVFALNAVGGIGAVMAPGTTVLPSQIIDYTYGREHTFATFLSDEINHIDFSEPFSWRLSEALKAAWCASGMAFIEGGVLGCTQGPRLETAAEVRRLQRDGCDIVGMTTMPEAALARELGMEYVAICTVVNWAAGIQAQPITLAEIHGILDTARPMLRRTLLHVLMA